MEILPEVNNKHQWQRVAENNEFLNFEMPWSFSQIVNISKGVHLSPTYQTHY